MTCSLWAGRNPVNDKRVVCIEQPCSHGALPNQSHPALNGTEWKCVCQGGGDSLCISKTAKGFYAKCKLQPESYKSMKLLRTSDGGVIKANQSKGAGVRGHISEHLQSAARPRSQVGGGEEKQRKTPNMVWQPALIRPSFFFFCHPTVPACSQRNSSDENELKISVYSCWCCSKPVWILKNIDEKNLTDEGSLSCSYSEIILWPGRVKIQNRDTLWNERESAIKLVRNLSEIFAR